MSPGLPANKRTNEKSYAIQCLRAVAALMVVLNHSVEVMNVHSHLQWAFVYGNYGVDVFFVISGFIMLFSTPETMTAMGFLARRLIRIIPLYWTMTILFSLAAVIAPHLFNAAHPDPVRLVKSLLFIPHYHATRPEKIWPILTPGWTLTYEMAFYAVFTVTMLAFRKRLVLVVPLIMALMIALGVILHPTDAIGRTYTNPLVLEFVFGIFIAATVMSQPAQRLWLLVGAAVVLSVAAFVLTPQLGLFARPLSFGAACAALVGGCVGLERRGVNFNRRIPTLLGDASYSIYLVQYFVLGGMRGVGNAIHLPWTNWWVDVGSIIVALVASSVAGILMFTFFEKPIGRFLQRVILRRGPKPIDEVRPVVDPA